MTQEQTVEKLRQVATLNWGGIPYGEYCSGVVMALAAGAGLRVLAKTLHLSKSKLHRDLPMIRAVAAVHRGEDPTEAIAALSHVGQGGGGKPLKSNGSNGGTVPLGTPVHVCPCCGHVFQEASP